MTLGSSTKAYYGKKKTNVYPPQGVRCQKCLEYGHWSYECTGKRKYVHRSSRSQQLKKRLKAKEEGKDIVISTPKLKHKALESRSSDSDSTDSDSSTSDSSDSSTSDSETSSSSDSSSDTSVKSHSKLQQGIQVKHKA
ncbi:uncharacterized protein [Leptinotarsa decemlineata]|uniref:uncharacterized protein n=1 Tax=Leptinotarsa decemlineata TaxID=7539 RepID=UPI000C254F6B|nr:zinc finger CCHC domain-containing protein 10-like [Leptinotarsa decemlineata]